MVLCVVLLRPPLKPLHDTEEVVQLSPQLTGKGLLALRSKLGEYLLPLEAIAILLHQVVGPLVDPLEDASSVRGAHDLT